jgi:hypothetical protein
MDAGMLIMEAVIRFWAGTPKLMYAIITEPAIVENPLMVPFQSLTVTTF